MVIRFDKIQEYMVWLGVILLAFVNSVGMGNGGSGFSGSVIPLLIGEVIWGGGVIYFRNKVGVPYGAGKWIFIIFIAQAVVSTLINVNDIVYAENINTTGVKNCLSKGVALTGYLLTTLYVYNVLKKIEVSIRCEKFKKMLNISFFIAGIYSLFEILSMLDNTFGPIVFFFDSFFRGTGDALFWKVRSVTYEPSTVGNYLSVVLPFFLVQAVRKKIYILVLSYALIMAFMTYSRTVYLIVGIEVMLISVFLKSWKLPVYIVGIGIGISGLVAFFSQGMWFENIGIWDTVSTLIDDGGDSGRMNSNGMRYGSQIAAVLMFLDNPLWGVGLGQATFHLLEYVPAWAWQGPDMFLFQYNMVVFGVYPRILAEQGIIGMLLWMWLWGNAIYRIVLFRRKCKVNVAMHDFSTALLVCTIGFLFSEFNWDMISYPANWILLALAWALPAKPMSSGR